ncbi:hypothetical protein ACFL1K_00505 [Candidatus Omnitrophota bacterium]
MGKRGIALVFGLLVILVLSVLVASLYYKAINENNLTRRSVASSRAFWLAEAGIAEAIANMPNNVSETSLGGDDYTYSAETLKLDDKLYQINSTGSVWFPGNQRVRRDLTVIVKTGDTAPNNFLYALESTVEITVRGQTVYIESQEENSEIIFSDRFGLSEANIRAIADEVYGHLYEDVTETTEISGVTWVEPTSGEITIAGNFTSSGILVIDGDAHFSGTLTHDGIIYVQGNLMVTGDVTINGAILSEASTEVDTEVRGTVQIYHDEAQIEAALLALTFINPEVSAWEEVYK